MSGAERTTPDVQRKDAALQASESRFRALVETAPALIFAVDFAGRNSFVNERYQRYTGLSFAELCGDGWRDVIHPDDRDAAIAENLSSRSERGPLERRLRIRRHDGVWRWFLSRTEPVPDSDDEAAFAWLGISIDIEEQVQAEEREQLLSQEVDHRAKNLLAVVQSILNLTPADEAASFRQAVNGRIEALSRTHSLLAASHWDGIELHALIDQELAAFYAGGDHSPFVSGPAICLKPAAAQSMGLVIHELATNATKHGALSVHTGRVAVTWTLSADGAELTLSWRETGGPPVCSPERQGFGSNLIRMSVERQLGGTLTASWEPAGLACDMTIPGEHFSVSATTDHRAPPTVPPEEVSGDLSGKRILVVEDEPLIAMQIERALTHAGCVVLGPTGTVGEATDLVVIAKPDAALLDVNLGGARSYPLADILQAKGIPFAFCTGYAGVGDLPARFLDARTIAKPFVHGLLIQTMKDILANRRALSA